MDTVLGHREQLNKAEALELQGTLSTMGKGLDYSRSRELLSFIYLFIQQTLDVHHMPGTVLGSGDTAVREPDKNPHPVGAHHLVRGWVLDKGAHEKDAATSRGTCGEGSVTQRKPRDLPSEEREKAGHLPSA